MDHRASLPPYDGPQISAHSSYSSHHNNMEASTALHTISGIPHENIALTWSDGQILGPEPEVAARMVELAVQAQPTTSNILPPRSPSPVERPPDYVRAQRPMSNISYSFSPLGANAMVLLPPATAQDTRPQYYITVTMNCFMPLSHITTVYRGANEYGTRIGEFEMGIIGTASRVQMGNQTPSTIAKVLFKSGSRQQGHWTWNAGRASHRINLRWDYSSRPCNCYSTVRGRNEVVAKFTPHLELEQPVNIARGPLSQLEIMPNGQELFDDILLSLLIIERKRLTPKVKTEAGLKDLFN